ncbi:MAG TPA: D-alanine--D-alanine ligase family protein [Levilinea sp.]|nr:D-alanine--D-alanine ligase family protein [Levilinea sp.]
MQKKIRIGVVFGGRSGEHEVSLMSARSVLDVLDPQKYEVIQIGITLDGSWVAGGDVHTALKQGETSVLTPVLLLPEPGSCTLYARRQTGVGIKLEALAELDVVFPVLHGTYGEDGTLQGLLEMANLPYVGDGVLGSAVGMDKGVFKSVMRAYRLPVLADRLIARSRIETEIELVLAEAESIAPYPLFVKPANLGSSVGVTKCHSRSDLLEGMMEAARYDRRVMVERGVNAREIEISVLGNDNPLASIPGEIIPHDEFYTYRAKYFDANTGYAIPAELDASTIAQLQDLAVRAYQACDCAGMARVDFLLDKDTGEAFISEINTIPGFTQISMYPKLWQASGLPYPALIDRLVDLAFERKADRDRTEYKYGSAA